MSTPVKCSVCAGLGRIDDYECWNCRELPDIDADEYLRGYIDGAENARSQAAVRELADLGDGSGPAGLQLDAAIRSLEEASARVERVLELTPGPWV